MLYGLSAQNSIKFYAGCRKVAWAMPMKSEQAPSLAEQAFVLRLLIFSFSLWHKFDNEPHESSVFKLSNFA